MAPRRNPPGPIETAERLRARILPARDADSRALDVDTLPFTRWREFIDTHTYRGDPSTRTATFAPGEHVTGIARTGRGKTTLFARGLLPLYPAVVYLGTKETDPSAYPWLERHGFQMTSSARLDPRRHPKVIYRPGPFGISKADKALQTERFRAVLAVAYAQQRWAIYADEVAYLDEIGLAEELEAIWRTGRGREITLLAASQNPVSIPRVAFDQVSHLFLWRQGERERAHRMAEMAGENREVVQALLPKLPEYEVLYDNTTSDELVRTRFGT